MRRLASSFALALLAIACCGRTAIAQCPLVWSSGGPQRELTGDGRCSTIWDPDGAGPLPSRFVVGGASLVAGGEPLDQRVMTWDGTQWQALGPGPGTSGAVRAMIVWNGALIAAGEFTGGGLTHIAQWNGSAWQPLATGFPSSVYTLGVWNGSLVAAGLSPVLRTWNGSVWTTLPTPAQLQVPLAIVAYQGLLCVGGHDAANGGVLVRWNGSTWSTTSTASNWITSLVVRSTTIIGGSDTLYAGGFFTSIGGTTAAFVAATSGGSTFAWNPIGGGLPSGCRGLHVRPTSGANYHLVALLNDPATPVMQLNGGFGSTSWTAMGTTLVDSVNHYTGSYHAANSAITSTAGLRYDGAAWVPIRGPGIDGIVRAVTRSGDDAIVGGDFAAIAGVPASCIARWDGAAFQPLGAGMSGLANNSVDALLTLRTGDVVAGGLFATADGATANSIARWNGSAWSSLGTGTNQQVLALCEMPNGDVVAAGGFTTAGGVPCARIARWNGTTWSPLGSGMNAAVRALVVRGDGVLFAGGVFTTAGGVPCNRIAQWNGSAWLPLGAGCDNDVRGLAAGSNGEIVAVGSFTSAGGLAADRCARWLPTGWAAMGAASADPAPVRAVLALPDGDFVVSHGFHTPTNVPDEGLARWNGTTWSAVGTLSGADANDPVTVLCLASTTAGELLVGGDFHVAPGAVARNLTKVRSTCMPFASPLGAGCSSAAGPLVLTADTLPWLGATLRTTTTGIAPVSLCLGLTGFAPVSIPLPAVLAEGQPGCTLLASPDILDVLVPDGTGTVHTALALANDPALLGGSFFQQALPLEFDASFSLVAVRASNALALTIGTL